MYGNMEPERASGVLPTFPNRRVIEMLSSILYLLSLPKENNSFSRLYECSFRAQTSLHGSRHGQLNRLGLP